MYEQEELVPEVAQTVRRVVQNRLDQMGEEAGHVRILEHLDPEPRTVMTVEGRGAPARIEFFESVYTRGALAYDEEYVQALVACGRIVLHYPDELFDDGFMAQKAWAVISQAKERGADLPEVTAFLYSHDGEERKVL